MDEPNIVPETAQEKHKRRLSKGWIIFLVALAVLAVVFCPKKLSWVFPMDKVTFYQYYSDSDEWTQRYGKPVEGGTVVEPLIGSDLEALRRNIADTWVVWAGWTRSIAASDLMHVILVSDDANGNHHYPGDLWAAESEISPGLSILSPYLDNEHTIYKSSLHSSYFSRYVSLGSTLRELIPELSS